MAAFIENPPARPMRLAGTPQCHAIVDVCIDADVADDPYLIPCAFRPPIGGLAGLAVRLGRQDAGRNWPAGAAQ